MIRHFPMEEKAPLFLCPALIGNGSVACCLCFLPGTCSGAAEKLPRSRSIQKLAGVAGPGRPGLNASKEL